MTPLPFVRSIAAVAALAALAACTEPTLITPPDPDNPLPGGPAAFRTPFLIGNTGADEIRAVRVDGAGAVWVGGTFSGTVDFDPTSDGQTGRTAQGPSDAFLAAYSPSGRLLRVITFGGTGDDAINAIAVSSTGDIVVGGSVSNGYLCPGVATSLPVRGTSDAFTARFSNTGTCRWIAPAGADGSDDVLALALDGSDNVFAGGSVSGLADFDPTPAILQPVAPYGGGTSDGFVASYGPDGAARSVFMLGNGSAEAVTALASDASGDVALTLAFTGILDADPTTGTSFLTSFGLADVMLSRHAPGGTLRWAGRLGGTEDDLPAPQSLVWQAGRLTAVLNVRGLADLDPGVGTATVQSLGATDVAIGFYDAATGALAAAPLRIGNTAEDEATGLQIGTDGRLLLTGRYAGLVDFDPGPAQINRQSSGNGVVREPFLLSLTSTGTYQWVTAIVTAQTGGPNPLGRLGGLAAAPDGSFWAAGTLAGLADADASPEALVPLAPLGASDGVVLHYSATGTLIP